MPCAGAAPGDDGGGEGKPEEEGDDQALHRLCPTYAQDINSPFRHVRTRIYFTSERCACNGTTSSHSFPPSPRSGAHKGGSARARVWSVGTCMRGV